METKRIVVTTPQKYFKKVTGVLTDEKLLEAIEAKIKNDEHLFLGNRIKIYLSEVVITIEQQKFLREKYVKISDKKKWSCMSFGFVAKIDQPKFETKNDKITDKSIIELYF